MPLGLFRTLVAHSGAGSSWLVWDSASSWTEPDSWTGTTRIAGLVQIAGEAVEPVTALRLDAAVCEVPGFDEPIAKASTTQLRCASLSHK